MMVPGVADLDLLVERHVFVPDGAGLPELLVALLLLMGLVRGDEGVVALLGVAVDTRVHLRVLEQMGKNDSSVDRQDMFLTILSDAFLTTCK